MHLPDGYLSPATAGFFYAVMAPFWYAASRKIRRILSGRMVPMMALLSAFCFVIQMINIPLPGGTTGHAVGASLAAIILGPWPAVLTVSVALFIQALFFGDGGITAIGANCFNMALAQVFTSHFIYSILSGQTMSARRRGIAAGIAGYISLNVAALMAGVELGLQPFLAHSADGTPLYAPYGLSISVPAMAIGHLFAGIAEAIITGAGIAYLSRNSPEMLWNPAQNNIDRIPLTLFWSRLRILWGIVGVFVILTPIGLLAPGTAWGEWASAQFKDLGLGFVPIGLQKMEGLWTAFFPGYSVPGLGRNSAYIVSAFLGLLFIIAVFLILTFLGKACSRKQNPDRKLLEQDS